jgi:hypothetical protein
MKWTYSVSLLALLAVANNFASPGMAQDVLGRLESDIRQGNGQPGTAAPASRRVYLGAIALDEVGRGVRIASVQNGGPAQHAGLQPQDLVVSAAGKRIQSLSELTAMLRGMNPGDRLLLEAMRGARRFRVEVVLSAPPGAAPPLQQPSLPPSTGLGAGRTDTIPPPPTDLTLPAPAEGPALIVPQPAAPNSPQAQIEELRRRVDQLERRVQELERQLAEAKKK